MAEPDGAAPSPARGEAPRSAGAEAAAVRSADDAPKRAWHIPMLVLLVGLVAYAFDLATKLVVVAGLENRPSIELLGGFLTLRVIRNSGAAFGLAGDFTVVLSLVMIAVIAVIVRIGLRLRSVGWAVSLGLILGGALGNLTDRILRAPAPLAGHVVDWIEVPYWPVFNLADSAIVCGGVLAVVLAFRGVGFDGRRVTGKRDVRDAQGDESGRE